MPRYYESGEQTQSIRYDDNSRSDHQPVYIGFAEKGKAESDEQWTIHRFTYDANGFPTHRMIAVGAWEHRKDGTLTYG